MLKIVKLKIVEVCCQEPIRPHIKKISNMRALGRPEAGADITSCKCQIFLLQTFGGQPAKTNSNEHSGNGGAGALQLDNLVSEKEGERVTTETPNDISILSSPRARRTQHRGPVIRKYFS